MCKTFDFYAEAAAASGERAGLVPVERETLDGRRVVELYDAQLSRRRADCVLSSVNHLALKGEACGG